MPFLHRFLSFTGTTALYLWPSPEAFMIFRKTRFPGIIMRGYYIDELAICRVPFSKWVKFLLPLFAIWWVVAFIFLILAPVTGCGPF